MPKTLRCQCGWHVTLEDLEGPDEEIECFRCLEIRDPVAYADLREKQGVLTRQIMRELKEERRK